MNEGERVAEVCVLGPLEARVEGRSVPIVRPKQRAVLAVLALDAGTCVSIERLTDEIWGAGPPGSVRHSLQVHVSGLRKLLGPALIETCPGGYRLAVPRDAVDALRAESLVAAGRGAEAAALFRGRPLEDVDLESQEAGRLEDLRGAALEQAFDAQLGTGAAGSLVAPLERLVEEFPLRERLRAQLMLALYRAGRQADALAVFQAARQRFVEELGIDPSPALRELERKILQQDPALDAPATVAPVTRDRRRSYLAALAFACVAGGAGLAAAYLIQPGHGRAAGAPGSTRSRPTGRPIPVRTATTVASAKRSPAVHHRVVRPRPTVVRKLAPRAPTTTHEARPTTSVPVATAAPAPRVTTTHPIRTVPPPPSPPPATTTTAARPSGPVTIADTFDGGVVDQAVWNVLIDGSGADAVQRDGKLVISIAPGAEPGGQWNFVGVQYGTKQCFTGDLDMQVDYRLVSWPASSGAYVSLNAVFANAMVERFSPTQGAADVYGSIIDPRFVTRDASGANGSLRLRRVGGIVTTYYLDGGVWQQIDSAQANGAAHLHIGLSMNPGLSPSSEVVAELDNFSATAAGPISGC